MNCNANANFSVSNKPSLYIEQVLKKLKRSQTLPVATKMETFKFFIFLIIDRKWEQMIRTSMNLNSFLSDETRREFSLMMPSHNLNSFFDSSI